MTENSENLENTGPRTMLWVVLVLSAAANAAASSLGAPLFLSVTLGVVALMAGAALVVRHYRRARTSSSR
jgi:hypothetical protein